MMFVARCARLEILLVLLVFSPGVALAAGSQTEGTLSLGYRLDSLDWNISGGSAGPNILSELDWREMEIVQLKGTVSATNDRGIHVRGFAGYGWVRDGVNQDSDYNGDNRTLEYSRSINDVTGSRVLDLSGGLGFVLFAGASDQYRIIPMLGYSYHNQDLRMTNGRQVVPATGPFAGLNSSYDAEWSGPWLGTDFIWDLSSGGRLFARVEAHWINYSAKANWNLRTDFAHPVSFTHDADGRGTVLELGWQEAFSPQYWVWGVNVVLQSWATESGIDRIFFSSGAIDETRLNEVNWSSRSINLTLHKSFAD